MILQVLVYKHLIFIILLSVLFYLIIPGIGAFIVRKKWRNFRKTIISSVSYPILDYKAVNSGISGKGDQFRFFGALQALQGETGIWLSDDDISIRVDLLNVPIYILPSSPYLSGPLGDTDYPEETPQVTKWDRIFSLPEGTKMFVAGKLIKKNGDPIFMNTDEKKLFIVIYDCSDLAFFSHAIWTGRQRNEYWNPSTPGSLTVGSFTLFIYFYILLQIPYMQFPAGASLLLSLIPIILFAPPGLLFYYLYRYLWKRARKFRAERDLVKLPLSFFPNGCLEKGYCSVPLSPKIQYFMEKLSEFRIEDIHTDNLILRKTSLPGKDYFLFLVKDSHGNPAEEFPDPMAENVIIPGNPVFLSIKSEKYARKLEILSGISILADFLINGMLFFIGIAYLIR